jgi:predicted RNA-binding protein YlqC (UPF0109 family)
MPAAVGRFSHRKQNMQFPDTDDIYEDDRSDESVEDDEQVLDDEEYDDEAEAEDDDENLDDEDDADYDDDEDEDDEDEDEIQPRGEAAAELESLVQFIAERLVHDPSDVAVDSEFRGGTVYISLRVPESEMGRVIGREGRTAKAIRTLVSIAGSRYNVHARLDIDG